MKRPVPTIAIVLFAVLAMGADSCDTTTTEKATTGSQATSDLQPEEGKVKAKPDGEYDLNCDYLLKFSDDLQSNDHKFVGGGTLMNTGNVGIRVQVTFKWNLLGQNPLIIRKVYKLKRGAERDINVSAPASTEQIDAHQSADGKCSSKVRIVGTFGKAR